MGSKVSSPRASMLEALQFQSGSDKGSPRTRLGFKKSRPNSPDSPSGNPAIELSITDGLDLNGDFDEEVRNSSLKVDIFQAILTNYPPRSIVAMIRSDVRICQAKDKEGHYPIYVAILHAETQPNGALADAILALITTFPKACVTCHDLSLHILIQKKYPESVILALVRADPKICRYADQSGHLPLLIAVERNLSVEVTETILNAYPDACLHYEEYFPQRKISPLNAAIRKQSSKDIIRAIIKKCPSTCLKKDSAGNLPIHVALSKDNNDENILTIIEASPAACGAGDFSGNIPLITAIVRNRSYEVIDALLRAYPNGIKCQDNVGYYPLHLAVKQHPSVTVIKRLIAMYPEACTIPVHNCNSYLPIHFALSKYRRPSEIIHELVAAAPQTCKIKVGTTLHPDIIQLLPLHLAVNYAEEQAVLIVMEVYREACQVQDQDGKTPLHRVLERSHDLPVSIEDETYRLVQAMLTIHPQACSMRSSQSQLPLHIAILHKCSFNVIDAILQENINGCKQKDHLGCCPIHLAVKVNSSIEIIRRLLQYHPDGCLERDSLGYTPLHYAAINKKIAIIQLLISLNSRACRLGDAEGRLPIHMLLSQLDADKSTSRQTYRLSSEHIGCIQILLKIFPPVANIKIGDDSAISMAYKKGLGSEILRLLLNAKPDGLKRNDILIYQNLNWNARKHVVYICHCLIRKAILSQTVPSPADVASIESISEKENQAPDLNHQDEEKSMRNKRLVSITRSLCQTLLFPNQLNSGMLHHVINYL